LYCPRIGRHLCMSSSVGRTVTPSGYNEIDGAKAIW
jgi:hypothetical protein